MIATAGVPRMAAVLLLTTAWCEIVCLHSATEASANGGPAGSPTGAAVWNGVPLSNVGGVRRRSLPLICLATVEISRLVGDAHILETVDQVFSFFSIICE
jgi:hypothetical protein